jgi:hypothetical protein|tara:strand:- start:5756 stop:6265 length:510 start_codon:yes stop_codon:yes gene_type:complete
MYQDKTEPSFDAPVAGMGMTHEVGARPWQQPAQYATIDEVAPFYISQMQDESFTQQAINLLETKMPVTMIANAMQTMNVMNGVHSVDVGVLTLPIIMEYLMLIADTAGIDYVIGTERNIEAELEESDIQVALQKIEEGKINTDVEQEEPTLDIEEEEDVMSTGLMARRS